MNINCTEEKIIKINENKYYYTDLNNRNLNLILNKKKVLLLKKKNEICELIPKKNEEEYYKKSKIKKLKLAIPESSIVNLKKEFFIFYSESNLDNKINNKLSNKYLKDQFNLYFESNDIILWCNILVMYLGLATDINDINNVYNNFLKDQKSKLNNFFITDITDSDKQDFFNNLYNLITIIESITYNKYNFEEVEILKTYKLLFLKDIGKLVKKDDKKDDNKDIKKDIIKDIKGNLDNLKEKIQIIINEEINLNIIGFEWAMNSCWFDSMFFIIFFNINMINYFKDNLKININNENYKYFNSLNNLVINFYENENKKKKVRNNFLKEYSDNIFETHIGDLGTADDAFNNFFRLYLNIEINFDFIFLKNNDYAAYYDENKNFYLVTYKKNNLNKDTNFKSYKITGSKDGKQLDINYFLNDDDKKLNNYNPIGIIIHTGGHYTAISKGVDDIWYYYDDISYPKILKMNSRSIDFLNLSILYLKK